ncbi:MAG: sugar phosphate isomerase/epimerase, partial [Acidimicrobiales bacterium]
LEDIPGERIFGVQIADGPAEGGGDLGQETFHRLMPGDGSFDLSALLRILDKIGALRWVGAEVISPLTAAMDPAEAACLARDRMVDLITGIRGKSTDDAQPGR